MPVLVSHAPLELFISLKFQTYCHALIYHTSCIFNISGVCNGARFLMPGVVYVFPFFLHQCFQGFINFIGGLQEVMILLILYIVNFYLFH